MMLCYDYRMVFLLCATYGELAAYGDTNRSSAKTDRAIPKACKGEKGYLKSRMKRVGEALPNCSSASFSSENITSYIQHIAYHIQTIY